MDAPLVQTTDQSLSVVLGGIHSRQLAHDWIDGAPNGYVISVERERRTLGQNDKFWTICSELAKSTVTWDGSRQSKEDWHDLLVVAWRIATGKRVRLVRTLEGDSFQMLGTSTRQLNKEEFIELLDYAVAWATARGIEIRED